MPKRKFDEIKSSADTLCAELDTLIINSSQVEIDLGQICTFNQPEKADLIIEKISELMDINNTIEILSLQFMYINKRACRQLIVYADKESGAIKIKLINQDNYSYHGEFSVPGFIEIDAECNLETNEPILSKDIAVFDRSKVHQERRFAFLRGDHPKNKESKACFLHHSFFNNPLSDLKLAENIFSFMEPTFYQKK